MGVCVVAKSRFILGIIGILLALGALITGVVIACLPTGDNKSKNDVAFAATEGNWTYNVSSSQATITAYSGSVTGEITIPSTLGGYPVVAVDDGSYSSGVFYGKAINKVSFPSSVTSIGDYEFYQCTSLIEVNLPSNLTTLGNYAFYGCGALTQVTIPGKITSFGSYCFRACTSLQSVTLSNGLTTLGVEMFEQCFALTTINWCNTLQTIGSSAFASCTSLTSVVVPDSVTNMGNAFNSCSNLQSLTIGKSVEYGIGAANCYYLTEINYNATLAAESTFGFSHAGRDGAGITLNIGANVQRIPSNFFPESDYKAKVIRINFAANSVLKSIGQYAFQYLTDLGNYPLVLPDSLETIEDDAFRGVSNLASTLTIGKNMLSVGNAFASIGKNVSVVNFNAIAMNDVSYLYGWSYMGCNKDSCIINIGANVKHIPANLFYNNTNMTNFSRIKEVNFVNGSVCEYIGVSAFEKCDALVEINLPNGLLQIGDEAFNGCSVLTEINLPNSLINIGASVFYNCKKVVELNFNAENLSSLGLNAFYNVGQESTGVTLNIGATVKIIPENFVSGFSSYVIAVNFEEGSVCEEIKYGAFAGLSKITKLDLPNTITTLSLGAISNLGGITDAFDLPTSLTTINNLMSGGNITTSPIISGGMNSVIFHDGVGHFPKYTTDIYIHEVYFLHDTNFTVDAGAFSNGNTGCVYYFANQSVMDYVKANFGNRTYFSTTNFQLINAVNVNAVAGDGCAEVSGGGSYVSGTTAKLYATPSNSTYNFLGWYNGSTRVSTANPYKFTVSSNMTLTALYQLNVTFVAGSGGTVSNAGGSCTPGATVSSTATPNAHYDFVHWLNITNGGSSVASTNKVLSVVANAKADYRAVFALKNYSLVAGINDTTKGNVLVLKDNAFLKEGAVNTTAVAYSAIKLIASAKSGFAFLGWRDSAGSIVSADEVLEINLLSNINYTAVFGASIEGISVGATYGGMASVVGDNYDSLVDSDTVTFVATICVSGYQFSHWENQDGEVLASGADNMSIRLRKDAVMDSVVIAVFEPI